MKKRYMDFTPVKSSTAGSSASGGRVAPQSRTTERRPVSGGSRQMGGRKVAGATPSAKRSSARPVVQMPDSNGAMRTRAVSRTMGRTAPPQMSSHRELSRTTARRTSVVMEDGTQMRVVQMTSRQTASRQMVPQQMAPQQMAARPSKTVNRGGNPRSARAFSSEVKLGEIEDLNAKFVKTDVPKRPLSKNASQQKKTVVTKEVTTDKPVTIITKPKKDSRVGIIVAIILTIILGAVAGTVAFLLLPK